MRFVYVILVAAAGMACTSLQIEDRGPDRLTMSSNAVALATVDGASARGLAPPELTVRPALALTPRYVRATVVGHRDGAVVTERSLVLSMQGQRVTIGYGPPGGFPLPVTVGQELSVRFYPVGKLAPGDGFGEAPIEDHTRREVFVVGQRRRGEPDLRVGGLVGWTLIVRDRRGGLVAVVFSGARVPLAIQGREAREIEPLRPGVAVAPLRDEVVYEEVRRLDNGCTTVVAHSRAQARQLWPRRRRLGGSREDRAGATFNAVPGTWRHVTVQGRRYRWVLLAASAARDGGSCRQAPGSGHFSFALLWDRAAVAEPAR